MTQTSTARRISTKLTGSYVTFTGYDGKPYAARVQSVKNGVATLVYQANMRGGRQEVTAYVSDGNRIEG